MKRFLMFISIAVLAAIFALLYFATDAKPLVNLTWTLSHQDIDKARRIIDGHFPDQHTSVKTLDLNEKELNIAANHLLRRYSDSATNIRLLKNGLLFATTIALSDHLFHPYLNIRFTLTKQGNTPLIKNLKIGGIEVPENYGGWLIDQIIQHSALKKYYILAGKHIRSIEITPANLQVSYDWNAELSSQARSLFTDSTHPEAIVFYRQKLTEIVRRHDKKWLLSLADLLRPLFSEALKRFPRHDAVEENRAIIFVVSAYVNQQNLQSLLPDLVFSSADLLYPVYLYKRVDLAKHFIGSAALTASGNAYLTYMLGLEKELRDAENGSGFSFIDLAADRAGMRFGETAVSSAESALKLQRAMARIEDYRAFMPDIRDLPENIKKDEFNKRFESIYSKRYQDMLKLIDERIAASPVYGQL
ncbi:MAG: hypothetical protein ACU833_02835 [Gammaproteobacteria bacterium]